MSCAKANPSVPKAKPSTYESMFYTNLAGAGVGLFLSVVTGQFHEGIAFCIRSPAVLEAIVAYRYAVSCTLVVAAGMVTDEKTGIIVCLLTVSAVQ